MPASRPAFGARTAPRRQVCPEDLPPVTLLRRAFPTLLVLGGAALAATALTIMPTGQREDVPTSATPAQAAPAPLPDDTLVPERWSAWLRPGIWETPVVHGESLFFFRPEGQERARAGLAFPANEVLRVWRPASGTVYQEGSDYVLSEDRRSLILPLDSSIRFREEADLTPPVGTPHSIAFWREDESRALLFGEGDFFHNQQLAVSYVPVAATGADALPVPPRQGHLLPKTRARLESGEPLKVLMLGDSIAQGANASSLVGAPPNQPMYVDLFAEALREEYGAEVIARNFSEGSRLSDWGAEKARELASLRPDLLLIAFGMNDGSTRIEQEPFTENLRSIIATFRGENPDLEVIVVAGMTPNPELSNAHLEFHRSYRTAAFDVAGPGVAAADVTSLWDALAERKTFWALTGNGVNHPNDFGHRLYAQVLLEALTLPE